jgi:hypothetical protein
MLAEVMQKMLPDVPYTSSDGTWENVIFDDPNFHTRRGCPSLDVMYSNTLYEIQNADYEIQNAEAIKKFRVERNALLAQSDKYVTKDYPHRLELDIQNWVDYRKALRDLPITARPTRDEDGNLVGVEWPTPPKTLVPDIYVLKGDLQTTKEELQSEKNKVATMELLVASLVKRVGDLENLVI